MDPVYGNIEQIRDYLGSVWAMHEYTLRMNTMNTSAGPRARFHGEHQVYPLRDPHAEWFSDADHVLESFCNFLFSIFRGKIQAVHQNIDPGKSEHYSGMWMTLLARLHFDHYRLGHQARQQAERRNRYETESVEGINEHVLIVLYIASRNSNRI